MDQIAKAMLKEDPVIDAIHEMQRLLVFLLCPNGKLS